MKTPSSAKLARQQAAPSTVSQVTRWKRHLSWWAPMLGALTLLLGAGCSTTPPNKDPAATVVVIPAGAPERLSYLTPMLKEEALERGLHDGVAPVGAHPFGFLALPLSMGIGAAQGLRGKTAEQIADAERTLTNTATALQFQQRLCETLVELGPSMTGHQWILSQSPKVRSKGKAPTEGAGGNSLVLRVELLSFGLEPPAESGDVAVNPTLRLRARVRCRVANLATGRCDEVFRFGGGLHKFLTWAENDAAVFHTQADRGARVLAEKIIKRLFAVDQRGAGSAKAERGDAQAQFDLGARHPRPFDEIAFSTP